MEILEDQGKGRIGHDNEKNRRYHGGSGGGAHRLSPAPDLKASLAADPGDEHGKDAGFDQAGDDIQQGQAVLGFLQVGVNRQIQPQDAHNHAAQDAEEVGIDREQGHHDHGRQNLGHGQKPDGIEPHGGEGVHFFVDHHGADFRGKGRSRPSGHQDGGHDGPQFLDNGDGQQCGHVDIGPELLELEGRHEGQDEAQQQADEPHNGQPVHPGPLHVKGHVLPPHRPGMKDRMDQSPQKFPQKNQHPLEIIENEAGLFPHPFQEVAGLALGDERRGGEGLGVNEPHDPPGLGGEVHELNRQGPAPGFDLQFHQGQGPGAVQVVHAGQVHGEGGGDHLQEAGVHFGVEGVEVIQGKPAGDREGDGPASIAAHLNSMAVPWDSGFFHYC